MPKRNITEDIDIANKKDTDYLMMVEPLPKLKVEILKVMEVRREQNLIRSG